MNRQHFAPSTMQELHAALKNLTPQSKMIAGGTDLVIHLNSGACEPDALLYVGGVPELTGIARSGDYMEIGAATTMTEIANCPLLCEQFAALMHAAGDVGSLQIRNRATIGGNVAGASPAGDLTPALFLLDAEAQIATADGALRTAPMSEVVTGPGKNGLALGEAIVHFRLPVPKSPTMRSAFVKLGSRKAMTISRIGLGVRIDRDGDGVVTHADVVAGAISLTPVHVTAAEGFLRGRRIDAESKQAVGKALAELIYEITPEMFDRDYKVGAAPGVAEDVLDLLK